MISQNINLGLSFMVMTPEVWAVEAAVEAAARWEGLEQVCSALPGASLLLCSSLLVQRLVFEGVDELIFEIIRMIFPILLGHPSGISLFVIFRHGQAPSYS